MFRRRDVPLRWRIAVLTALAITLLTILSSTAVFLLVRQSLTGDLQRALKRDASMLASLYSGTETDESLDRLDTPSARIIIQIYDLSGAFLAASAPEFEVAEAVIPQSVILSAREGGSSWRGQLANRPVVAELAPFDRGVVVVLGTTNFINTVMRQLAQWLLVISLSLIGIGAVAGYLVARAAMRPVATLARLAAGLEPNALHPIGYQGPNDELGKLAGVLNALIERLKGSMDAQRSFLAETSHELRTPLTSLRGFLERASRRANPEVQADLGDAKRIANTMSRLVSDLLQLSRGELIREMVPHLLDPYSDVAEPIAKEFPGVSLEGQTGETLLGDPERLRQLVRNLVSNAIRATGDNTKVRLRVERHGDKIRLEVHDWGTGIPEDMIPQIFNKFYKGPGGGAGLGLAIAKQIADAHGAELLVESQSRKGTRFILELPEIGSQEALEVA